MTEIILELSPELEERIDRLLSPSGRGVGGEDVQLLA